MAKRRIDALTLVLGALAEPTRRAIVEQLLAGPRSVGKLKLPRKIGGSTLSKHLSVLADAGLLTQQHVGRRRICNVRNVPLRDLAKWVDRRRRAIFSKPAALEH